MDLNTAVPFEVESTADLARWIVSSSEYQHGTLYLFKYNNKNVLGTLISFKGYFNYTGLPILLFTMLESEPTGSFIRFDLRSENKQDISFTTGFDETDSNLGYIQYIPIIKLKKVPAIFNVES